jgi:hypothetical protein
MLFVITTEKEFTPIAISYLRFSYGYYSPKYMIICFLIKSKKIEIHYKRNVFCAKNCLYYKACVAKIFVRY